MKRGRCALHISLGLLKNISSPSKAPSVRELSPLTAVTRELLWMQGKLLSVRYATHLPQGGRLIGLPR